MDKLVVGEKRVVGYAVQTADGRLFGTNPEDDPVFCPYKTREELIAKFPLQDTDSIVPVVLTIGDSATSEHGGK